ncbi:hypothetical protein C0J52_07557 [Blattella germanica]|nr:hypothetical protein C0J52_07557 [Blattella germanica]
MSCNNFLHSSDVSKQTYRQEKVCSFDKGIEFYVQNMSTDKSLSSTKPFQPDDLISLDLLLITSNGEDHSRLPTTDENYLHGECLNTKFTYLGTPAGGTILRLLSGDFPLCLKAPGERREIRGGGGVLLRLGDLDRII